MSPLNGTWGLRVWWYLMQELAAVVTLVAGGLASSGLRKCVEDLVGGVEGQGSSGGHGMKTTRGNV